MTDARNDSMTASAAASPSDAVPTAGHAGRERAARHRMPAPAMQISATAPAVVRHTLSLSWKATLGAGLVTAVAGVCVHAAQPLPLTMAGLVPASATLRLPN